MSCPSYHRSSKPGVCVKIKEHVDGGSSQCLVSVPLLAVLILGQFLLQS